MGEDTNYNKVFRRKQKKNNLSKNHYNYVLIPETQTVFWFQCNPVLFFVYSLV